MDIMFQLNSKEIFQKSSKMLQDTRIQDTLQDGTQHLFLFVSRSE